MKVPAIERTAEMNHQRIEEDSDQAETSSMTGQTRSCPLSFSQERMWILDQLENIGAAYHVSRAFRLKGTLDKNALINALQAIVTRHEVLCTTFDTVDGLPFQTINSGRTIQLNEIDQKNDLTKVDEEEIRRLLIHEIKRPFDLSRDLMLRASLVRLKDEEHIFLLVAHHIAFDGWSLGILIRELNEAYNAFTAGTLPELPKLPFQYADYAQYQREILCGEFLDRQLSYWKQHLAGIPPLLELPTDRPRPPMQSYRGDREYFQFPTALYTSLISLSQQEKVTLFMTLLGAFQVLLYRYTGLEDISTGTAIANRTRIDIVGIIGFFVNTLVLRTNLSGDPTFRELIKRVQDVALDAYDHQDLPFEKIVDAIQPKRSLSHSPLFQVMFTLNNTPTYSLTFSGLEAEAMQLFNEAARFDLEFWMSEADGKLGCRVEYNTDLFERETIQRMLGHFVKLLEGIVEDPDRRISILPILTDKERHQLLVEWNDTQADFLKKAYFHELFEVQAERTPDAVALVFENSNFTYHELNERANQLAHHLQVMGVGPEVIVGICAERSLEMIVGLLGILKAGGAYMPLDPSYPKERLNFMLEDSNASMILTQEGIASQLPKSKAKIVYLDADWKKISLNSSDNIQTHGSGDSLAYVIYTSGSTGTPKGVQISHGALLNFLSAMVLEPGLNDQDVLLAVTTLTFDIAALELFGPLIIGGRVVLISREVASDGHQLAEMIQKSHATVMQATPATWWLLVEVGQIPRGLKILCGGEALSRKLADALLANQNSLWNMYGPTETTIWSTTGKIALGEDSIPIGRPIANTKLYVLDKNHEPLPVGVSGELYIGGAGLARGYLNRPELTAEKFIPNPFSNAPSSRLYKTGDLVRYLPDGNIEFLDRTDHQVKIRGFRIELGEIETVLQEHTAVRECVVLAREDAPNDKYLVAYVVASDSQTPYVESLRSFLKDKLPEYMIPSTFVMMDAFPLTPSNKIDRRALPKPDKTRSELEEIFVAPSTELEKDLARIWIEVLGLERVGLHDNFFELGGHSLKAAQVINRVRAQIGLEVPFREIFESPTIAEIAETIQCMDKYKFS